MEWLEILRLFGITSIPVIVFLIISGWIMKKKVENYFNLSVTKFNAQIELHISKFKSDIDLVSRKNAMVFERINERKINAISEIHTKLGLLYKTIRILVDPFTIKSNDSIEEHQKNILNEYSRQYESCVETYLSQNLFVSEEICISIEKTLKLIKSTINKYDQYRYTKEMGRYDGKILNDALNETKAAYETIIQEFPKILQQLKSEFVSEIEKFEIKR